jgi:tripartite-type tricarboxylate transporter receptor subunit TctC
VNSLSDIVAMAKKTPGGLTVGTPPPPTLNYLGAELFKSLTGAEVTIVTYKGTGNHLRVALMSSSASKF